MKRVMDFKSQLPIYTIRRIFDVETRSLSVVSKYTSVETVLNRVFTFPNRLPWLLAAKITPIILII